MSLIKESMQDLDNRLKNEKAKKYKNEEDKRDQERLIKAYEDDIKTYIGFFQTAVNARSELEEDLNRRGIMPVFLTTPPYEQSHLFGPFKNRMLYNKEAVDSEFHLPESQTYDSKGETTYTLSNNIFRTKRYQNVLLDFNRLSVLAHVSDATKKSDRKHIQLLCAEVLTDAHGILDGSRPLTSSLTSLLASSIMIRDTRTDAIKDIIYRTNRIQKKFESYLDGNGEGPDTGYKKPRQGDEI
jgi:hypothetical protein